MKEREKYTVHLLDEYGYDLMEPRDFGQKKAAIASAKSLLGDSWGGDEGENNYYKIEVRENGECVWDAFHGTAV